MTHPVLQDVHDMCKARGFAAGPDPLVNVSAHGPAIVITVWEDPQPLTLDQVGAMQQPEFAHLYSVQLLLQSGMQQSVVGAYRIAIWSTSCQPTHSSSQQCGQ